MFIDVRYKLGSLIYELRKKVLSRQRNWSPLSRFIGRKVLTYRPSVTPCPDPHPLLKSTLRLIPWDGYVTEVSLTFLEDGIVTRETKYTPAESLGLWSHPKPTLERFEREEGMILYQKLLSLNTPTWKNHYRHYDQIMDGVEWSLTIENPERRRREYVGGMMSPPEWKETCALFGLD